MGITVQWTGGLCLFNHYKRRNFQRLALVVCGVDEGHGAVVVGAWIYGEQGDVVDADKRLVDIAFTLAIELQFEAKELSRKVMRS